MKMFSINYQKNHPRQLLGLTLTAAMLMSLSAVTSYSAVRSRSFSFANTNGGTSPVSQPQTAALKANGKIAFVNNVGNNYEIFTVNPDGSGRTQLTNNPGDDYGPAFSPDGNRIAFYSNRDGNSGIYLMNADGSSPIFLTSSYSWEISWSPGGNKIAFSCSGICVVNADGSNLTQVSNNNDYAPAWSPDGTKIAFTRGDLNFFGQSSIYVMNIDGSSATRLTNPNYDYGPAWSPDGAKIAFTRYSDCIDLGNGETICFDARILIINADYGSNETFLTGGSIFDNADAYTPTWSPDGTKIAFQGYRSGSSYTELFSINVTGGVRTNLSNTTEAPELDPDWGPLRLPSSTDDPQFFVAQHYRDFLNRDPDAGGLAFWTNEITSCGGDAQCIDAKRVNVSAAYFLSIEFQQTGYLVYRFYKASYGNLPDAPVPIKRGEFVPDTQQIGQGVIVNQTGWEQILENNKHAFASEFVQRTRFTTAYPTSLSPDQFVDRLFANAEVTPPGSDRADAINEFGSAPTSVDTAARARALRRVAEHSTLAQQEFNRAFVLMQYFGYLRRNPNDAPEPSLDFQGYNFWLNKLNQFNGNFVQAEMVKAFLVSGEYRGRFAQ